MGRLSGESGLGIKVWSQIGNVMETRGLTTIYEVGLGFRVSLWDVSRERRNSNDYGNYHVGWAQGMEKKLETTI